MNGNEILTASFDDGESVKYIIVHDPKHCKCIEYYDDNNDMYFTYVKDNAGNYVLFKASVRVDDKKYIFEQTSTINISTVEKYDNKNNVIMSTNVSTVSTELVDYINDKVSEFVKLNPIISEILKMEVNVEWGTLQKDQRP